MKKILVIEDNEIIRANIVELLLEQDFNAIEAKDGLIGVRLAQEEMPDLIVCDVMMPGLDGYGVLKALRQSPATQTTPFIFLTALDERADTRKGMELGADDFLIKPCKPDELLKAIATRLAKQSAIAQHFTTVFLQASQELDKLAHYDNLTNLPNRLLLSDQFYQILNKIKPPKNHQNQVTPTENNQPFIPILHIGLDRFNRIGEILGHACSDFLIKTVATRLQSCVEMEDPIARVSPDEFVIILASAHQKKAVSAIAQTILDTLSKPFLLEDGNEILIAASIGISLYPQDGSDIATLLQAANKSMKYAKQQGGNLYEFYRTTVNTAASDRLALEASLSYALEREELQVYYQPQVKLQTGQIVGAEALLRWYHPERGLISPNIFIAIAEETGLILPISEWVLKTACKQAKTWHNSGFTGLRMAVNLPGRQFTQPNLTLQISRILMETGLDPQDLELELTESILVQNREISLVRLTALKALGLQIAIDDFGTGYSSLSYLQQFPFDTLKIDQCFIRNLTKDAKTKAITTAIIQMAQSLNLKLIAEGVETEAEFAFLRDNNCDAMQGYLFSPPVKVEAFENLLVNGKILPIK
jgi:diguanylate cyclase